LAGSFSAKNLIPLPSAGATPVKWALPFTSVNFTGQAGQAGQAGFRGSKVQGSGVRG